MASGINWNGAERALATLGRKSLPSGFMDEVCIPARGPERDALFSVLWSTAEPSSNLAHLYLALSPKDPLRLAESGLDRFFALTDALRDRSSHLPGLIADIDLDLEPLIGEAADLVLRHGGDLFAFLGHQPLSATDTCLQCRGFDIGYLSHVIDLVSTEPHGIWNLRKRLSVGLTHFDDTIAENWKRWLSVLKRDFIAMVDVDALSLDAHAYLDAFPLALKSSDWRDALAAELSCRDRLSWGYPMIETIWELALERFERSTLDKRLHDAVLSTAAL